MLRKDILETILDIEEEVLWIGQPSIHVTKSIIHFVIKTTFFIGIMVISILGISGYYIKLELGKPYLVSMGFLIFILCLLSVYTLKKDKIMRLSTYYIVTKQRVVLCIDNDVHITIRSKFIKELNHITILSLSSNYKSVFFCDNYNAKRYISWWNILWGNGDLNTIASTSQKEIDFPPFIDIEDADNVVSTIFHLRGIA